MNQSPIRRQLGASLVEMMITLVLALVVTGALFQVYVSNRQAYGLQEALLHRQENLRFATLVLTRNLRMAGYTGCYGRAGIITNTLNDAQAYAHIYQRPIQGFESVGDHWEPELDPNMRSVAHGTDVLTIRTTTGAPIHIRESMPQASADLKIEKALDPPPFAPAGGDIVLISDCTAAALFQITQYTAASGNVVHNAGNARVTPGNATQNLGRRYAAGSELLKISTITYYISHNRSGTGLALWQQSDPGLPPEELAEGIENMQLLYGEDIDGDQAPDAYRRANEVEDWDRVMVVRVALLAVGSASATTPANPYSLRLLDTEVGPFSDGRLRRVIAFTVSLRSRQP